MARWSVVSHLIKYCGSSFEAWTVYPLNVMAEVIFFWLSAGIRKKWHSTRLS